MNEWKKKTKYFLVALLCLLTFNGNVNALSVNNYNIVNSASINNTLTGMVMPAEEDKCESLFGDPDNCDKKCPAYWMQWILNAMKYVAIGALLLFVTMDFAKALISNDKDALKKAGTTAIKRFIYCVLLFFLPIIVDLIMSMFGAYGTCGIG